MTVAFVFRPANSMSNPSPSSMRIGVMTKGPLLTIAYLERLPASSANAIAALRPQDAAALFETIPIRIMNPIMAKMEKWPAAQCLQYLSVDQAAAILGEIPYQDAMVLLRLTPVDRRDAILEQLPSRLAKDLLESLRYPRNCVGAWMDLSMPTLSLNATVKDAIAVVRAAKKPVGESIFVVDEDQRLAGLVRTETLLRHSQGTQLADIVQIEIKPLFARMLLREAAAAAAWNDFLHLPVAGRQGQLLGILSRRDLEKGLTTITAQSSLPNADETIWMQIGGTLVASLTGLLGLLGDDSEKTRTGA
jgi:Mg/Co/Ni transporter MgtE